MIGHWTDEQIAEYEDWLDSVRAAAEAQALKSIKKDGPPPIDEDRELWLRALSQ